jgi:membrane protease YdiL (CAAX protease family)
VEASRGSLESGRIRRWIEAIGFVSVWVAAGELLDMSADIYLLFGIPLTAGFQLLVRKRPIKDLWVRSGPAFSLRTVSLRLAIPLVIVPFFHLLVSLIKGQGLGSIVYALAAMVGAGAAAYALGQFKRETWRYLGLCVATAGLIGILLTLDAAWHDASAVHPTGLYLRPNALSGIDSLLLYIPALFMIEEVTFRGAIDSHVRHPGERRDAASTIYGIASAIFVSVLWGLWHHPIVPSATILQLLIVQVAVGPFLSLFWRKSGNLMVPGFAHALNDSVRNALGLVP